MHLHFSEDDENMLMLKSLDYKLGARKASASMFEALKIEQKKARKILVEQPIMVGGCGSSNHCQLVETDSSE
jgi:hypothetical protein